MRTAVFILIVLCSLPLSSKEIVTYTGTIKDSTSGESLRFVTVRLAGARTATISGKDGAFILQLSDEKLLKAKSLYHRARLVVSLVGYRTDTIDLPFRDQEVSISMTKRDLRMRTIFVSAEDPGERIMRKVLARKKLQTDTLDRYMYQLYTKFVVITDSNTAQRSTGIGDSVVFSILESYSTGYVDLPDQFYNEITQRRQTANIPPQANFVAFGTNLNIYDDKLTILGEEMKTPFHPDALDDYDFVLESDEEDSIVKIRCSPSRDDFKGFIGLLFVNQRQNKPLEVRLQPNIAVNLPFDAGLDIRQTFTEISGVILPEALSIISSVDVTIVWIFDLRLDIDLQTFCYEYDLETPFSDEVFEQRRVELSENVDVFDSTYWARNKKIPLRPEEARAYIEIQQFQDNADSIEGGFLDDLLGPVMTSYRALGREPFSSQNDVFRYNGIHGPYVGIGFQARPDTAIELRGKGGYGFNNKKWYGGVGATWFIDEQQKWTIEGDVFSELTRRDNAFLVKQPLITVTTLLFGTDYGDYYHSDGWQAGAGYNWGQYRFLKIGRWARANSIRVFYREERQTTAPNSSMWSLFGSQEDRRINPTIMNGVNRSINGELFLQFRPERRVERTGMYLLAEYANPNLIATDFGYSRVDWTGFLRTRTFPLFTLDIAARVGWTWGEVPPQRFFSLESAISGIAIGSAFRVMNVKEFYGDRYASLSLSHNWGEIIPGLLRIPNVASLGIEFITFGSIGWSEFRPETIKFNNTELPTTMDTRENVYYEFGVGINRLLLFLRMDVNMRLSQRDNPQVRLTVTSATF